VTGFFQELDEPKRGYEEANENSADASSAYSQGESTAGVDIEGRFGPNDYGTLPGDTRRALVQLVKGPYVMRERHANLWAALETDELAIRQALGNLFLELVLDHEAGLAFSRNLEVEADVPKMIRTAPLTLIDTALVLFLRDKLLRGESGRVFVGKDEIEEQLSVYGQAAGTDAVGLAKRVNGSIKKMKDAKVLRNAAEEGRFEISPILRLIFNATEVTAVAAELASLVESGAHLAENLDDSDWRDA
jgi:hypothetical protein